MIMNNNTQQVGIDAGGTLLKVVFQEENSLQYKTFQGKDINELTSWLNQYFSTSPVSLTGGQAFQISHHLNREVSMISEFKATCKGVRYLINEQIGGLTEPIIITNIGTGTSIHYINNDYEERLSGTGIGGGTFFGLSSLLTGINDFNQIATLSMEGHRETVDIKVKDIYEGSIPPISGELTASNFGKAKGTTNSEISEADQIAGVAGMVSEVLTLLSIHEAKKHNAKVIYYIGSTVSTDSLVKKLLKNYTNQLGFDAKFLQHGQFSGAIGSLLLG